MLLRMGTEGVYRGTGLLADTPRTAQVSEVQDFRGGRSYPPRAVARRRLRKRFPKCIFNSRENSRNAENAGAEKGRCMPVVLRGTRKRGELPPISWTTSGLT